MKKLAERIRTIGLIANPEKHTSGVVLQKAASLIRRSGRSAFTEGATAALGRLTLPIQPDIPSLARKCDLLLVFGGDGTMLRVAREVAGIKTPILGINLGGLGFLTAVPSDALPAALRKIWEGRFVLESRPLLEARGATAVEQFAQLAFNDFVISRGTYSRLIQLEVKVDGEVLTEYRCDGLIVSSPTGSTAYSLAAGGPVVSPDAEVFALTPICPHTLSNRSVMVNLRSIVQVKVISQMDTILSADGQVQTALASGDSVTIQRSQRLVHLVRLEDGSFFKTLRHKLRWSGSSVPSS